MNQWFFNKITN